MAIILDTTRNCYYISFRHEGKQFNIKNKEWSKNKVDKRFMKTIEYNEINKKIESLMREQAQENSKKALLKELTDNFLEYQFNTKAEDTAYGKEQLIKNQILKEFDGNNEVNKEFTPEKVKKYYEFVLAQNVSDKTKNVRVNLLRELIRFADENELIEPTQTRRCINILKPLNLANYQSKPFQVISAQEFDAFLSSIKTANTENDNWELFMEVAYWGALRLGEALGLEVKDIHSNNNSIFINEQFTRHGKKAATKTKSSRGYVELPTFLMKKILEYTSEKNKQPNEPLFFKTRPSRTTIYRMIEKHAPFHFTMHTLRHSMATRMLKERVPVAIISKHLRHSSTHETIRTYTHYFEEDTLGIMDEIANKSS